MKTKRRVYPRVDVNITITHLGNAINISEGGMCVIVDDPLPVGHKIDLDLVFYPIRLMMTNKNPQILSNLRELSFGLNTLSY